MSEAGEDLDLFAVVAQAPWSWRDAAGGLLPILGTMAAAHRQGMGYGARRFGSTVLVRRGLPATVEEPTPLPWVASWTPREMPLRDPAAMRDDLLGWIGLLRLYLGLDDLEASPAEDVADGIDAVVPPDVARAVERIARGSADAPSNASVMRAIVALALDLPPGPAEAPVAAADPEVAWGTLFDEEHEASDEAPDPVASEPAKQEMMGLRDEAVDPTRVILALVVVLVVVAGIRVFIAARARVIPSCEFDTECRTGNCTNGYCAPLGMALIKAPDESNDPALPYDFFLGVHEVTQAEYRSAMGSNPSWFQGCGPACPVESVSVYEAISYLNTLSRREGLPECYQLENCRGTMGQGCDYLEPDKADHGCDGGFACETVRFAGMDCEGYRLPTVDEWRHAAMSLPSGDQLDIGAAINAPGRTRATGYVDYPGGLPCPDDDGVMRACGPTRADEGPPNAWGMRHMNGNVQEWVYAMGQSVVGWEAVNVSELGRSAVTGGAWAHDTEGANIAQYAPLQGATLFTDLGFRVARTAYRAAVR